MAFNGLGTFVRIYSWVTDAANNLNVDATRMDTDTNDIATGLSNCVTKDGQQTLTANLPMAGFKLTGLGLGTTGTDSARVDNANSSICEFRLTLTSGTPVVPPMTNVSLAGTIYCTPYKGNHIALYDGSAWHMRSSAEFSIAAPVTANKPHDVFCYDNAGVPTLETLVWTSDTARATALAYQDGVLVKSGAATRRYLGTVWTDGASQITDGPYTSRHVWNYYNRVRRPMMRNIDGASYNYTTATYRQANAGATNQLDLVIGVDEDMTRASIIASAANTSAGVALNVAIGLDSTTTPDANNGMFQTVNTAVANDVVSLQAQFNGSTGIGRHKLVWLEKSAATGTTTWNADATASILGEVWG